MTSSTTFTVSNLMFDLLVIHNLGRYRAYVKIMALCKVQP